MSLQKVTTSGKFSDFMATPTVKKRVNEIIGGTKAQSFITHIVSAVSTNPQLAACEHSTIFSAALIGESLNLAPSPQLGYYYLVPFKEKDKKGNLIRVVATFQLGYRGYIQLALRSGKYADIDVMDVREGEYLGRDKFTGKHLFEFIADDEKREQLPVVGYMAYFELLNGFRKTIYWSKEKMINHAKAYSQSYKYDLNYNRKESFWSKDFEQMAFKTLLRQLLGKWGIMSIEMAKGYDADMTTTTRDKDGKEHTDYLDNTDDLANLPIDYGVTLPLDGGDDEENGGGVHFAEPDTLPQVENPKSKATPKEKADKKESGEVFDKETGELL